MTYEDLYKLKRIARCERCDHWGGAPDYETRYCSRRAQHTYKLFGCEHWEARGLEMIVREVKL
jgi:hypothetical protein